MDRLKQDRYFTHALKVYLYLERAHERVTAKQLAELIGTSERTIYTIFAQLERDGYIKRTPLSKGRGSRVAKEVLKSPIEEFVERRDKMWT